MPEAWHVAARDQSVFDGQYRIAPDMVHSIVEDRLIAIGRTFAGRPAFVAFTLRRRNGDILVRPVSARFMHLKEVKRYEDRTPDAD